MRPKAIMIIVLIILFLILIIQNTDAVKLHFLFWELQVSRIILIPFFTLIGFLAGYVIAKLEKPKMKQEKRSGDIQN